MLLLLLLLLLLLWWCCCCWALTMMATAAESVAEAGGAHYMLWKTNSDVSSHDSWCAQPDGCSTAEDATRARSVTTNLSHTHTLSRDCGYLGAAAHSVRLRLSCLCGCRSAHSSVLLVKPNRFSEQVRHLGRGAGAGADRERSGCCWDGAACGIAGCEP